MANIISNSISNGRRHIADFAEYVRASFWAIPGLMIVLSIFVALFNLWVDSQIVPNMQWKEGNWLYFAEIESIRSLLSTTAAAILGVAGVSFSITIASLTLASQQFGPRLIRTFMRDRFTQTVLGFFVATFLYCMLSMQIITVLSNSNYIPIATLFTVLLLTIIDLVLLVLFIHHISVSIQVDSVISEVANEMKLRADSLFTFHEDAVEEDESFAISKFKTRLENNAIQTLSEQDGYIRFVDYESLLELAEAQNLLIQVLHRAGDYVLTGTPLYIHVADVSDVDVTEAIDGEFCTIGGTRTPQQDLEHIVRQLVEIAMRALSPGINDTFTAMTCIDSVGSLINLMSKKKIPSVLIKNDKGIPKLLVDRTTYSGLVDAGFDQIRQNAAAHVDVLIRVIEVLTQLAGLVPRKHQTVALINQAKLIHENLEQAPFTSADRLAITQRIEKLEDTVSNRFG